MKQGKDTITKLSELGYRITPQRIMILNAVQDAEGHISAEEIYSKVRATYSHLNISTVYRTLELLEELKLVTETDLGEGRVRYHSADKGHHHHLICQKCGAVIDMDDFIFKSLAEIMAEKYGFVAEMRHLAIFGHCRNCR